MRARRLLLGLAVAALAGISLAAQQKPDPRTIPGTWKPFPATPRQLPPGAPPWLTRDHLEAMRARLAEIAEVFHKTPVLASPVGFTMFPKREIFFGRTFAQPTEPDRRWVVPGHLMLSAAVFPPDGGTVYDTGSAFVLNFNANDLGCVFDKASPWAVDAEGTMFLEVLPLDSTIHGFPVYRYCVLVTHRTEPLYVPVSQERVLGVAVARANAGLATAKEVASLLAKGTLVDEEVKKQTAEMVTNAEAVVKRLRDDLAALDPAARKAPAYVLNSFDPSHPLSPRGTPDARAVVEANPAFFDQTRPADIQVLAAFVDCVESRCDEQFPIVQTIQDQLDWKALAAIVR